MSKQKAVKITAEAAECLKQLKRAAILKSGENTTDGDVVSGLLVKAAKRIQATTASAA